MPQRDSLKGGTRFNKLFTIDKCQNSGHINYCIR